MSVSSAKEWLVLICGFCGSKKSYAWMARLIARRFGVRVLVVESLRFGEPEGFIPALYSCPPALARQAHHVRNEMNKAGISQATIVGHSLGGLIGALLAKHHPEKVNKLILANTAGLQKTGFGQAWQFVASTYGDIKAALDRRNMHRSTAKWFGLTMSPRYLANVRRTGEEVRALNRYTPQRFIELCKTISPKIPVRVMFGALDKLISPLAAKALSEGKIDWQMIEGVGHDIHCHEVDALAKALN